MAKATKEARPVVALTLPIHTCFAGVATRHIDFQMTRRQAAAAKVLWCSMAEDGVRFEGGPTSHPAGKSIDNANHGLRAFLDLLADAIEAETGKSLAEDFQLQF